MKDWADAKKILCIRADNMGDVLMSTPAFRAIKESFYSQITLLTSSRGAEIAPLIPEIDETIVFDSPWVQVNAEAPNGELLDLIYDLKSKNFDGCIVFSVYSQSSLPAALLAYLAEIPLRLAYSREKPYALLSHWVPDKEPYSHILHQVERDLHLVDCIGAKTDNKRLSLTTSKKHFLGEISSTDMELSLPYLVFHPGVSEKKRRYPLKYWIELGKLVKEELQIPIVLTGSVAEAELCQKIAAGIGAGAYSTAGDLSITEVSCLIREAEALIAVNTGTVHIAAAIGTPVLVFYAQTNPQHYPWMVPHVCLEYSVPESLRSKNEVISYVNQQYYQEDIAIPTAEVAFISLQKLLSQALTTLIAEDEI